MFILYFIQPDFDMMFIYSCDLPKTSFENEMRFCESLLKLSKSMRAVSVKPYPIFR